MKKLLLILMLALGTTLTISSCTEDEVKPYETETTDNGGGGASEPIRPD